MKKNNTKNKNQLGEEDIKLKKEIADKVSKRFRTLIREKLNRKGYPFYEKDIYRDIGISKASFNHYKNGDDCTGKNAKPKYPDLLNLYKIHKYFNVTYSYLLGESTTKTLDSLINGTKLGLDDKSIEILELLQNNANKDSLDNNYSSIMKLYVINSIIHDDVFLDKLAYLSSILIGRTKINEDLKRQLFKIDDKHLDFIRYETYLEFINYLENANNDNTPEYIRINALEIAKKYAGSNQQKINNK